MKGIILYIGGNLGIQLLVFVGLIVFFMSWRLFFHRFCTFIRAKYLQRFFFKDTRPVKDEYIESVLCTMPYYTRLSEGGKIKFKKRLDRILQRLEFSTAGEIDLDREKKVLLAAASVTITFGLDEFDIDTIEHIKVFADDIYDPKTKARFKGLTFQNGNMFISWKHFLTGHEIPDDGINLAIHETAHGLYIMIKEHRGYDDFDNTLREWSKYAWNEIDHEGKGKSGFLRQYAAANIYEFFAVCIENFVERPAEFKKRLPLIYNQLCIFLNQDPMNGNDHALDPDIIPQGPITERVYLFKNRTHPSQGFLLWLSGCCVISMIFMKAHFLETLFNLLLLSVPCLFVSYKIFKKFFVDSKRMTMKWYLVFCFTAINPILFTIILLLNLWIGIGIHGTKTYKVTGTERYSFDFNQNDLAVLGKDHRVFMLEDNYTVPVESRLVEKQGSDKVSEIEYSYHYGILGLKIVDSRKLK